MEKMSKRRIKKYSSKFKAKIVLEVLKEDKTLAQIGSKHETCPRNIQYWKKQFLDNVEFVFDQDQYVKKHKIALEQEKETVDELHRQIGKLTAQLNWAKKKSTEIGLEY